jgi:hypothetical protein
MFVGLTSSLLWITIGPHTKVHKDEIELHQNLLWVTA